MDISVEEPVVVYKCSSRSSWITGVATAVRLLNKPLKYLKRHVSATHHPTKVANEIELVQTIVSDQYLPLSDKAYGEKGTNRIQLEMLPIEAVSEVAETVVRLLDKAINYHQSDYIAEARKTLQTVFQLLSKFDGRCFEFPTGYGRRVLERGRELFLKGRVSCSVKHGTLLLDSSNGGAEFYVGLLNVVGAFAVTISEYQLSKETYSMLISLHRKINITSHLRDLGAAFSNAGCMSLIEGDLNQAEIHFKNSLKNLKSAEKIQQSHNSSLEVMLIAVQSNNSRLFLISRNFGEALEKQEQVVKSSKTTKTKLPLEVVFTVLNNQAVMHTTLANFGKAEEALKCLISYCTEMKREDCDFLMNFVSLHHCEVLLRSGKSKQAEKAFSSEMLKRARGTELSLMFGGLHINVRTEAYEKVIDVLVRRGYVKLACGLLEKAVNKLKKSFGPDHFNFASLLYKQGTILSLIGDFSSSIEKFKSSIAILEKMFGVTHPLLLNCYMSLGDVALSLKREDESYYYFQRAMENIEVLYQVSFVSQLSRKYVEMTRNAKTAQQKRVRVDRSEGLIEDLVAEHGLAFAVLLSRLVVQSNNRPFGRWKTKGKQPLNTKSWSVQCSDTIKIISLKSTRDFLQSGQTFLRQGMTKEAAAFFQQAGKYCGTHQVLQSSPNPSLAHLYSVLTKKRLGTQDDDRDLIDCLEELSEVPTMLSTESNSKRSIEDTATVTSDCQLNLKLVLIFLILLSIQLKMFDTTFAAYDLYSKLSQNDEGSLLFLNDGVQVYTSRTSITCNGNTAVQDVLVSSTPSLDDDSKNPSPENELFRSLACKKNVATDNFLVSVSTSILLDIDDLQVLERRISLSIQEHFQRKCFETGIEGNETQVVVDLTSKSTFDFHDILSTGRQIELLSLCLSEEANVEVSHGGNIFEISTAMCQKITRLTFEDEQTSSFMFSKNALFLLQQYNSGKISTLSVERQCLSMTVFHPIKARVTLWRMEKCIEQRIQFVQAAARCGQTRWTVPQQKTCKEPVGNCRVADKLFWPAIEHLAKTYQVKFQSDVVDWDERQDVSSVQCQRNRIIFDRRSERCVQISSDEIEENETLTICLNASVLEGLSAVSDISRQLYGDGTQEGDHAIEVVPERTETSRRPTISQSHLQQEIISGTLHQTTLNPEAEKASHNFTSGAPDSAAVEEERWTREENPTVREEDDENDLGRSLFEKDRISRRSFMVELQKSMKNKEENSRLNFLGAKTPSDQVIRKGSNLGIDPKKAGTSYVVKADQTATDSAQPPFNAEPEIQIQNMSEPWSDDGKPSAADEENALGRHSFEEDINSRSDSIAKLKDPRKEEISHKSSSLGDENSPACEETLEKHDFLEDPNYDKEQKDKSTPVTGASTQMKQEDDKQTSIETSAKNVLHKVKVEDATLLNVSQSETRVSTHDQTRHRHRSNLQEIHRPGAHTTAYDEMDRENFQFEGEKDYTMQQRYRGELRGRNEVDNEPPRNKGIVKPDSNAYTTKRRTSRSSFEVDDDIVPDGPVNANYRRIQSNSRDSMPLTNTNVVGRPLERVGKNLQIQARLFPKKETGMGTRGSSNVDDNGTQSTGKSQFFHINLKETTFRHTVLGFLGGDVLVDGDNSNASCAEEDVVNGPVSERFPNEGGGGIHRSEGFKTSVDISKEISIKKTISFPLDTARDAIDGPAYSPKTDASLNNKPLDFGGARPKERSPNTIRRISLSKNKITDRLISAYQDDETEAPGVDPRFLARHTVKSNGAIFEATLQDGYEEPYFSAKTMADGKKLREPWGRFSPPGHAPFSSGLGLDAEQACATRTSTRGDVQSLAIYQKHPLNQKESWHFPNPVTNETTAMQSNFDVYQGCAIQQYSTQVEDYIISRLKERFSSSWWRRAYNEMDLMTNEYHNSIGDDGAVQSTIVSAGQQSSTEDSTSSLLGSLQEIMAKTVKLIASRDTVSKQSQQEPKEIEKVGIQEEARGSRDQEQSVTAVVEDSRNQEESSQENEQTEDTERQSIPTPVQETPRPVCSHYQRRCLVRFPCCGKFYPCHRCHNESEDCSDDQARAINATHIRCTICYHEQAIDEQSQHCGGCKSKMSEYFCAICKHFTSVDKNPFHCGKCGICRIHKDRSFHCDVCNVCLDKRLQGKHKCRPDSGHDECCICLEDAFSGCQILPCSHKVHKDCAIAMIQNGVRTCPICRHPLFTQPQNSPQ